jgi:aldose 1-epimerase
VAARTGRSFLGKQYFLNSGGHTAIVTEVGAGLQRYAVGGVDVTHTYSDDALPPQGCGATLVPWPNRIRDGRYSFDGVEQQLSLTEPEAGNAIHGLGRWSRWDRVRHSSDELLLRLDVVPQRGYPFPVRVEVTYALDPDTGLSVSLGARNTGRTRIPFGAGSHPYLATRGRPIDDVTLQFPARQILDVDDQQIPTGARSVSGETDFRRGRRLHGQRLDSCFTDISTRGGRGYAELRTRAGSARVWFDAAFGYLQVFTHDALGGGPPAVAIEPMTCAPNAFNSGDGLLVLEPGESWSASWGITPR